MTRADQSFRPEDVETQASFKTETQDEQNGKTYFRETDADSTSLSVAAEREIFSLAKAKKTAPATTSKSGNQKVGGKALPALGAGLLSALSLAILFSLIASPFAPGLQRELISQLPLQLFWTYCIYQICHFVGRAYKSAPPLSGVQISVLSILSFVCLPVFNGYHFVAHWLDPFFLCWVATQLLWVFAVGRYIANHGKGKEANKWLFPLILTVGANAYLILDLLTSGILLNMSVQTGNVILATFFRPLWFISQFGCIAYLNVMLERSGAHSRPTMQPPVTAGSDVVIRYKAFGALERWYQQRFAKQRIAKEIRMLIMWVLGPAALVVSLLGLSVFFFDVVEPAIHLQADAPAAIAATAAANLSFVTAFIFVLMSIFGAGTFFYLRTPTHIGLGRQGLRFLWRRRLFSNDGQYLPWSDLGHVSVERSRGKTSPLDDRLRFLCNDGKRLEIPLGCVDSVDDRESLLKAIQKWAPSVSRDASVVEALQPPADYSYTELWLQALSAPPKRQRFQPLISGAMLREGHFQVLKTLGIGGQGQAYLAKDNISQQEVVLKEFILPVYVDVNVRRTALEQFENEAKILRQLDNPQIVKLVDFFVEDHRAYLVLEYIRGASLREIVRTQGALPENQVRALAVQMCAILSYLHKLSPPVVHRDFSPDNLVLNVDGTLKLIDFNVAKQSVESTTSGTVVGKHAYLPPEQFRGQPVVQSDIYAMGATLYYLLVGHDPEPIAVSHPATACEAVSEVLSSIVERATALDLQKRYQNVEELKQDLLADSG